MLWLGTEGSSGGGGAGLLRIAELHLALPFLSLPPSSVVLPSGGQRWWQLQLIVCAKFKSTTGSKPVVSSHPHRYLWGSGEARTDLPQRSLSPPLLPNKKSVNFRMWLSPQPPDWPMDSSAPMPLLSVGPSTESEKVQSSVRMSQTHGSNACGTATCLSGPARESAVVRQELQLSRKTSVPTTWTTNSWGSLGQVTPRDRT